MTGRADPFGDQTEQGIDLRGFKPKPPTKPVKSEEIRKVAETASFQSREPVLAAASQENVHARRYRTGRNIHFSCKVKKEVEQEIYAMTDELARRMEEQVPGARWTVGLTVERMVAALRRELDKN